jgi:hypothetical protein
MDSTRRTRQIIRWTLVAASVVVLVVLALEVTENDGSPDAAAGTVETAPATVEHIDGTDLARVTLTASAAERVELRTVPVAPYRRGARMVVPYSALIYDEHGQTWVYTRHERLTFVRAAVTVDAIRADRAILSAGPSLGVDVVSVGAAELFGSEFEVDH